MPMEPHNYRSEIVLMEKPQPQIGIAQTVTGAMIRTLRVRDLGQSLSVFGWTLKRAMDPRATYPYTRQYISRLEKGQDPITPEIAGAFWSIAAAFDEVPAGIGGAVPASVRAAPNQVPEGSYIPPTAKVVRCARPGCPVLFLQDNPLRKYHHPDCREQARKARERQRNAPPASDEEE